MVCHIGVQLGTEVVKSALRMLALYMCFNRTGIRGGETLYMYNGWRLQKIWLYYLNYTSTKSIPASSKRHFKCFVNLLPWQQ